MLCVLQNTQAHEQPSTDDKTCELKYKKHLRDLNIAKIENIEPTICAAQRPKCDW